MADAVTLARLEIANLRSGDILLAQFMPEQLERQIDPTYNKVAALGMSHEQMQFQFRQNEKVKLTLYFDQRSLADGGDPVAVQKVLDAMTLPSREARDIASGGPPDVMLLWPEMLTWKTRITSLKYTYKRFAPNGAPVYFQTDIGFEEARDTRLFAEDVMAFGLQRF